MGIARTVINWGYYDCKKEDLSFEITLSTNNPNKVICYDWWMKGDDGTIKRKVTEHRDEDVFVNLFEDVVPFVFREFKELIRESGIPIVAQKLRERIERKKENDPAFRPSEITDELLVKALNTLSRWEEIKLVWTTAEANRLP